MKTINVSIGICAYNEEKNIQPMLESVLGQKTEIVRIEEIIVISDGSTDKTNQLVESFSRNSKIKIIKEERRCGKYVAVNNFLKIAKSPILVLASADIILDKEAVENLCAPFLSEDNIGITGARPIPKNHIDSFMGYVANLQWYLHHKISLVQPKFGELVAFRNIIDRLPPTLVDEEQIASAIKNKGYKLKYVPQAIVYNKGPENIIEFIARSRRIFVGHLVLTKDYKYEVSTLKEAKILSCLAKDLPGEYKKNICWLLGAAFLELLGRILGKLDFYFKRYDYKWTIAETAKDPFIN